jgi:VIT1/CCC1 family predicted Fe2+/Mn2+ transporter
MREPKSQIERHPHSLRHWAPNSNPSHREDHSSAGSFIRELVFGANDGLVSNVSLVAGVAGATTDPNTVLLAGVAGIIAGAISMGLGAYVSTKSEHEFRESEERRERWEIDNMPAEERAEVRQIFQERGISGPTLDAVVAQITTDKDQWVRTMMHDELGFSGTQPEPVKSGMIMAIAFCLGGAFPVAPFLIIEGNAALAASTGATGIALFGVGAWRAKLAAGNIWRKGLEMVGLAGIAVLGAYFLGRLIGVSIF